MKNRADNLKVGRSLVRLPKWFSLEKYSRAVGLDAHGQAEARHEPGRDEHRRGGRLAEHLDARTHAEAIGLAIDYRVTGPESIAASGASFDAQPAHETSSVRRLRLSVMVAPCRTLSP